MRKIENDFQRDPFKAVFDRKAVSGDDIEEDTRALAEKVLNPSYINALKLLRYCRASRIFVEGECGGAAGVVANFRLQRS